VFTGEKKMKNIFLDLKTDNNKKNYLVNMSFVLGKKIRVIIRRFHEE
jgi:hypothetical protein